MLGEGPQHALKGESSPRGCRRGSGGGTVGVGGCGSIGGGAAAPSGRTGVAKGLLSDRGHDTSDEIPQFRSVRVRGLKEPTQAPQQHQKLGRRLPTRRPDQMPEHVDRPKRDREAFQMEVWLRRRCSRRRGRGHRIRRRCPTPEAQLQQELVQDGQLLAVIPSKPLAHRFRVGRQLGASCWGRSAGGGRRR